MKNSIEFLATIDKDIGSFRLGNGNRCVIPELRPKRIRKPETPDIKIPIPQVARIQTKKLPQEIDQKYSTPRIKVKKKKALHKF